MSYNYKTNSSIGLTNITQAEYKAAVDQKHRIVQQITKSHIMELRSMQSANEVLLKLLRIIGIMKSTILDPWDFLVSLLKKNSFKSELLVMSPEKVDKERVKDCIRILLQESLITKARARGKMEIWDYILTFKFLKTM